MTGDEATAPRGLGDAGVELASALAVLGSSVTSPRRAIVAVLLGSDHLQTPEQLLWAARAGAPETSLATVYRTLERLDMAGRIKRATLASGAVAYAYCPADHHEHAICVRCGRSFSVSGCLVREPSIDGFTISAHVLDLYGNCDACAPDAGHVEGDTSE